MSAVLQSRNVRSSHHTAPQLALILLQNGQIAGLKVNDRTSEINVS